MVWVRSWLLVAGLSLMVVIGAAGYGWSQEKKDEAQNKPEPETVTAVSKPFEIFESFEGVFESTRTMECIANVRAWTDLEVKSVVEQGTAVKKDYVVLSFETEELDRSISEARFGLEAAQLDLADAKLAAEQMQATLQLDQDLAERTINNAKEDHEYYKDVSRPQRLKDFDFEQKSSHWFLEYAQEELDQLLKMYNEDELTEESEQIVLKRAQRGVESAERNLEQSELNINRGREIELPRADKQEADQLQRAELAYAKSQITLPIQSQRTEIAAKKSEFELSNKQEKFDELMADSQYKTLTAPMDGILYHGQCERGKWMGAGGANPNRVLESGKKAAPRQVLLTVVDPTQMAIRADLDEKNLKLLKETQKGTALVNASTDEKLAVTVEKISRIPMENNKYDCQLKIADLNNDDHHLMPGMTCKISVPVYSSKESIVVPSASVFTDDQIAYYVYQIVDGKPSKVQVEVGHTSGSDIEIKRGLSAGDKILKEKPKS